MSDGHCVPLKAPSNGDMVHGLSPFWMARASGLKTPVCKLANRDHRIVSAASSGVMSGVPVS